jgi:hypothetical protein
MPEAPVGRPARPSRTGFSQRIMLFTLTVPGGLFSGCKTRMWPRKKRVEMQPLKKDKNIRKIALNCLKSLSYRLFYVKNVSCSQSLERDIFSATEA